MICVRLFPKPCLLKPVVVGRVTPCRAAVNNRWSDSESLTRRFKFDVLVSRLRRAGDCPPYHVRVYSANVINPVPAAIATYCFPSTRKVTGPPAMAPPVWKFQSGFPVVASST